MQVPLRPVFRRDLRPGPGPLPDAAANRAGKGPVAIGEPHRHRSLHAGWLSSLGSFSSRFRELVGESPSEYPDRWAAELSNLGEAWPSSDPYRVRMITHVSLATIWVNDQDEAKAFYTDKLGFQETVDVAMGDGYRWVTVCHPDHPELELTLMRPGPPLDEDDAASFRRMLDKGSLGAVGLATDDCHRTYQELTANGVTFIQEPADRPYGVEAILRDNSGNWLVLVEPKPFSPDDIAVGP
jgi:catechol 2,3-dioxygenase-like lactoylglutathione lyase family enzyme